MCVCLYVFACVCVCLGGGVGGALYLIDTFFFLG